MTSSALRILFFGTPDFAVMSLKPLLSSPEFAVKAVVTQPDRPAGRGKQVQVSPVKALAQECGIPVLQPEKIRRELKEFLAGVEKFGPFDVGVVVAFGQIIPLPILNLPRAGCVNVHASLLPRWRGAAPIHRALLAGDTETGVCLMKLEEGLDTGPVYARASLPITEQDTFGILHDKLAAVGGELLAAHLSQIAFGIIPAVTQPSIGVTYAEKIAKNDAPIDWAKSAPEISRQVRALNPFPGAVTKLKGRLLKVFAVETRAAGSAAASSAPGTIVLVDRSLVEVACGSGIILLKEVQLEGKRRMEIGEFLRGQSLSAGERLGE